MSLQFERDMTGGYVLRLVFCTSTMHLLTATRAGNMDGAFAVEHAHNIKLRKYAARCEANGLVLVKSVAGNFIKIRMNHVAKCDNQNQN